MTSHENDLYTKNRLEKLHFSLKNKVFWRVSISADADASIYN